MPQETQIRILTNVETIFAVAQHNDDQIVVAIPDAGGEGVLFVNNYSLVSGVALALDREAFADSPIAFTIDDAFYEAVESYADESNSDHPHLAQVEIYDDRIVIRDDDETENPTIRTIFGEFLMDDATCIDDADAAVKAITDLFVKQ